MTIHIESMPEIDEVTAEESWEWLRDNHPKMEKAIRAQVRRQFPPDDIYHYVKSRIGEHRDALAYRCKLAAVYLYQQNGSGES